MNMHLNSIVQVIAARRVSVNKMPAEHDWASDHIPTSTSSLMKHIGILGIRIF